MQSSPTKKQRLLLDFIDEFTAQHDYSPSYREIMNAMGLRSVSAVAEHIENCVAAGFLRKIPKSPRSLEVRKSEPREETVKLFKEKIAALSTSRPDDPRIKTLEASAEILGIKI